MGTKEPTGYYRLTSENRTLICRRCQKGKSFREIGRLLGKSASTICCEVKRNKGRRGYRPKQAARNSGWCPWCANACANPYAAQMLVFPHANNADIFYVDADRGVLGPMAEKELKAKFPDFKDVLMPEGASKFYVWPVSSQKEQ